jgi:asparagine synthase (glutamine-hydrolysing)
MFLVRHGDPGFTSDSLTAARAQFARHGFTPREYDMGGWTLLHAPQILGGPPSVLVSGEDLVAVAGTLTCDGRMGTPALEALLQAAGQPEPDWHRIGGQFVALVRRGGRTFLFTDFFGAFQIFHDPGMRFFSTSLLAATQVLPRVSFDPQGVYEFAFNVTPIGDDTIFAELKTLGPDRSIELTVEGALPHPLAKPLPVQIETGDLPARIAVHRDRLMANVEAHVGWFGDQVNCALSGGLDSRLVLAALRAAGSRPRLFVYGDPDTADVTIAQRIAAAEGMEIDWMDKGGWRTFPPDAFPEHVARNFEIYDGIPNFGSLFENGANADALEARHRNGALSASGGCGEVFRNFFFLPDRPLTAAAVVRTFFARYRVADTTNEFDEQSFLRRLEDKVLAALGRPGDRHRLPRAVIEQVYPRVRCRALFGREISIEARYGAYLMPFLDHRLVTEAMRLPLPSKNAGRFEAGLLASIDPALAAHPSAYGHNFRSGPNARHRFDEWSTRIRPIWLRQKSYLLRRRLGPMADEHGGLLSPDYLSRVVDLSFPVMRRFFRTDAIADSSIIRRIANLEYFAARLGSRLTA